MRDQFNAQAAQKVFVAEFLDANEDFKKNVRRIMKDLESEKGWDFLCKYLRYLQVQKGIDLLNRAKERPIPAEETAYMAGIVQGFNLVLNLPQFVEESLKDTTEDTPQ